MLTPTEMQDIRNHLDYCLAVRWEHEGAWFEVKQVMIDADTELITLTVTKDDGVPVAIIYTKDELAGAPALPLGEVSQRIYEGML